MAWVDPFHLLELPYWVRRNQDGVHYDSSYYTAIGWEVLSVLCRHVFLAQR